MAGCPFSDDPAPWPRPAIKQSTWSPSATSTTSSTSSSSAASVFSIDAPSSQSSVSSVSEGWSSSAWNNETEVPGYPGRLVRAHNTGTLNEEPAAPYSQARKPFPHQHTDVVAVESRQHPRRTQRLNSNESRDGKCTTQFVRPPPSLVRQSERKDNFVDSLVDTTTQMIETIWPLSVLSCGQDTVLGSKQQNLIGLRTFVQEVLRRSKTSYSTLQVALYYLILIQSCLPKHDFTMEQVEDSQACRAMQCGRRMFLAALILASKYLQDRNFSARAWSKISGLGTNEINGNEKAFLSAVDWKLHIPESVFHRWTDIVLKYSPSAQVNASPKSSPKSPHSWKAIIPQLTPDLDDFGFGNAELSDDSGYDSPGSDMSPPAIPMHEVSIPSTSNEPTPTNPYSIPKVLEPTPRDTSTNEQALPPLPKLGPLPTPQLTPRSGIFCTPAVSASGLCPRTTSMSCVMGQIRESFLARTTLDNTCDWKPRLPEAFPTSARRSSLAKTASSMSSPESMISDRSSRSSRSSSISSVTSSNCALAQPRLAVQAKRRCANPQLCDLKEESQPTSVYTSPRDEIMPWEELVDLHKHNRLPPHILEARSNPWTTMPQRTASTREAAAALHDLALNRTRPPPTPQPSTSADQQRKSRKRSRPNSIDLSVQSTVRDLIAPRCLSDILNLNSSRTEDDSNVLADEKVADSFVLRDRFQNKSENMSENVRPLIRTSDANHINANLSVKPSMSLDGLLPRKRTCGDSDRAGGCGGGRDEARRMLEQIARGRERGAVMGAPGMWTGIL